MQYYLNIFGISAIKSGTKYNIIAVIKLLQFGEKW